MKVWLQAARALARRPAYLAAAVIVPSGRAFIGKRRLCRPAPPKSPVQTTLHGKGWVYVVPFAVKNKADIEKLIQCESQGVNVSRPDSDGITSDGILQYHRGPDNTMASGTWEFFSKLSGIEGSPLYPDDAIKMADWAISHGYGPRWTCWRIMGL